MADTRGAGIVVTVDELDRGTMQKASNDNFLWFRKAEELIEGDSRTGFQFTFEGDPLNANKAIKSAIVCFDRYRVRALQSGRFKQFIYVIQKRGPDLYVYNVPIEEAPRRWKHYNRYASQGQRREVAGAAS